MSYAAAIESFLLQNKPRLAPTNPLKITVIFQCFRF